MRHISFLIIISFLFFSCKSSKKTEPTFKLSDRTIFNEDSVLLFTNAEGLNKSDADKLFLKGVDTYRNKKNPAKAIQLFKQSIFSKPLAKAYYELGNAYLDVKNYKSSVKAYKIAEKLGYKPLSKLLYNTACAYSLQKNDSLAIYYLVSAIEFGYNNTKSIFSDKDLSYIRSKWYFKQNVADALSGSGDADKLQWNLFSREFKQLALPLTIDMSYANGFSESQTISYDYEKYINEMRDEKFSREVGKSFYSIGVIKGTNDYKVLIYASRDELYDEETEEAVKNIPTSYYAISLNNSGTLIDKIEIGGRTKLDAPFKVPTINDNSINISLLKLNYEKDPEENGYSNNKIISSEEIESQQYTIAPDGHFIKS